MSRHWEEYTNESSRRGYPGNQRKRKRKRRRVGFLRKTAAVFVVIAVLFALKNVISNYLILTGDGIVWNGELNAVYEQAGGVSGTLRDLVGNNPERGGFVRDS